MAIFLISFADRETLAIYDNTETLTVEECRNFAETATRWRVVDAYEVKSEELQYYLIDSFVTIDTKRKADKIKNFRKIEE